jgi:hypothetical protein
VFDQFFFGNQPLAPLQQIEKHLKGLLPEALLPPTPRY